MCALAAATDWVTADREDGRYVQERKGAVLLPNWKGGSGCYVRMRESKIRVDIRCDNVVGGERGATRTSIARG